MKARDFVFYDFGLNSVQGAQFIVDYITNARSITEIKSNDIESESFYSDWPLVLSRPCIIECFPRRLDLGHNSLRDDGVRYLVSFLLNNKECIGALEELNLATNHITDEGLDSIVELLNHPLSNLRSLFLQHNQLGHSSKSLVRFSNALTSNINIKLRILSLTNNVHLGDTGIAPLLEALSGSNIGYNSSLIEIHLNQCGLTDSSAERLHNLIKNNSSLDALRLSGNHLTENSLHVMAYALRNNTRLRYLETYGNDTGRMVLYNAIRPELVTIPLTRGPDARTEIDALCSRNEHLRKATKKMALNILVPGRIILHAKAVKNIRRNNTHFFCLPPELHLHIIRCVDDLDLLTEDQWKRIHAYITQREYGFSSVQEFLSHVKCD